jgi:hypothetical protein
MSTQVQAGRTALVLAAALVMFLRPGRAPAAIEDIFNPLDRPLDRLDRGEPPALRLAMWGRGFGGGWGGGYGGGYGGYGGGYRGFGGGYGGGMPYGGYQAPQPAYPSYPPPQQYGGYPPPEYGAAPQMYQQYQRPYAYPQQGQNPQQAAGAMTECQTWASEQTGYHPMAPGAPQGGGGQGGMGRAAFQGGAEGAALGAIGGSFGGHAGRGAEEGAAIGGLFNLLRRREQMQAEQQQQQQEQQAQTMASAAYSRALESCLTGRGYNVR